jgi:hypothetical protein
LFVPRKGVGWRNDRIRVGWSGMADEPKRPEETSSPVRNFTLTLQDRIRAMMGGPPAWMRRRRRIEDMEAEIVQMIERAGDFDPAQPPRKIAERHRELLELIDRHNRYFPIEARLPMDPATGVAVERGKPWAPMEPVTVETLVEKAARQKTER